VSKHSLGTEGRLQNQWRLPENHCGPGQHCQFERQGIDGLAAGHAGAAGEVIGGDTLFALIKPVSRATGVMVRMAQMARCVALLFSHWTGHVMVHGAGSIHDAYASMPLERQAKSQQAGKQETKNPHEGKCRTLVRGCHRCARGLRRAEKDGG
jgi:hypothetical protein